MHARRGDRLISFGLPREHSFSAVDPLSDGAVDVFGPDCDWLDGGFRRVPLLVRPVKVAGGEGLPCHARRRRPDVFPV